MLCTVWVRTKLDPFSFEHSFGKYCLILIFFLLLQTKINSDQMYPKISHRTPNLLVHYLVKWSRMYWPMLLVWFHDYRCNHATVKQFTLSVTDMDKINIVGSQSVHKMSFSSFSMNTRSISSSPLVNSLVKNWLFKTAPDIDEALFQFINIMDLSVVDMMLNDSPDLVIHRTEIWAVWRPQVGPKTFRVSWRSSSTVASARRGVPVYTACLVGTKSRYQTLCVSLAALWRHCDVVKQHRRRQ